MTNKGLRGSSACSVALTALCLVLSSSSLLQAGLATEAEKENLKRYLTGKAIVPKVDFPVAEALVVVWNGDYDREFYLKTLRIGPPSVLRGERATIREVEVRKDNVVLNVNSGGSVFAYDWKDAEKQRLFELGTRIQIHFGRKLTSTDVRPEKIVQALRNVATVEGEVTADAMESRPDEKFGDGAPPPVVPPPPPQPGSEPKVELVAAEVQPAEIRKGEKVTVKLSFQVAGLASAQETAVNVRLQVLFDGNALLTNPRKDALQKGNGLHAHEIQFPIPGSAQPGSYTFQVWLVTDFGQWGRDLVLLVKE
ncbi:MAG: hypothetical protein AB1714_22150 [Acidobacteriota bacterium]